MIEDALDLHTFRPAEAADLVAEYLRAAQEDGLAQVRIIHGKGTGRLRKTVEAVLRAHPAVAGFGTAPAYLGGWGATVVRLHPPGEAPAPPTAEPAPAAWEPASPPRGTRRKRVGAWYARFSPVLSILAGVAMAARMRTNYDQVRWLLVALGAAAGLLLLARLREAWRAPIRRAAGVVFANVAWFTVPFYLRSSADPLHWASLAPLAALVFLWEWAPWRRHIDARPAGRAAMRSLTVFYLLNMALPTAAALPLAPSWWLACAAAGAFFVITGPRGALARLAAAAALAALAFAWRPFFPPVPMVVKAVQWEPAIRGGLSAPPPSLTLQVAVFAPQGLKEKLVHVWMHEGRVTDRIPLEVAGGRQEGFRTRSRKQHWPAAPGGRWRVELRTEDGRRLGASTFQIKIRNLAPTLVQ